MPKVSSKKFFEEQTAHSRVKADIVFKFVMAWLQVVLKPRSGVCSEAAYADLFSGPGSYQDGRESTPLLIMKAVLKKPLFREGLRMFFNDKDPALTASLKQEIEALPEIQSLRSKPSFTSEPASLALVDSFHLSGDVAQFYFLDQFGWADITADLIERIFRSRRCDCAFFLRTSRVIAAVTNSKAEETMRVVFGDDRLRAMRHAFKLDARAKEKIVLNEVQSMMKAAGATHFAAFPFRVREERSSKHHLIYLGKHPLGLSIMKDIMGKSSSTHHNGVPVMGFSEIPAYPSLFEVDPIPDLQQDLLTVFAGKTLTVGEIYTMHHPTSTRFLLRNYQEALRRLEMSGAVAARPGAADRVTRNGKVTMSEMVVITFPTRMHDK